MLPDELSRAIELEIGPVRAVQHLGGGDVSSAARVDTSEGRVFAKWGRGAAGQTYAAEADGLAALRALAGDELVVSEPIAFASSKADRPGWLMLEWIEPGRPSEADWQRFGRALAALHQREAPGDGAYGWHEDNWIGSKPQRNGWVDDWPTFFGEKRLLAQVETVRQRNAWNAAWDRPLDALVNCLDQILPGEPHPALLHGDLWAGNALATSDGRFALIDPAVHVGHGESDIAMTELFGGFASSFYAGYREVARARDVDQIEVYQLYHLINHLTHGPGYAGAVARILNRWA
ncbi:MAG: fructosamine kinase family protein [Rubricoccaceae bacterium]